MQDFTLPFCASHAISSQKDAELLSATYFPSLFHCRQLLALHRILLGRILLRKFCFLALLDFFANQGAVKSCSSSPDLEQERGQSIDVVGEIERGTEKDGEREQEKEKECKEDNCTVRQQARWLPVCTGQKRIKLCWEGTVAEVGEWVFQENCVDGECTPGLGLDSWAVPQAADTPRRCPALEHFSPPPACVFDQYGCIRVRVL
eukprot:526625-Rhodomonas_salina.5